MTESGSISEAMGFVQKWVQNLGSPSVPDIFHPQALPSDSPWISKAERKRVEDILALMPPPPMINFAVFQDISLEFNKHFRIGKVAGNSLKAFGAVECSVLLGAVGAWAGAQIIGSQLIGQLMQAEKQNPIDIALKQYISQAKLVPVDTRASMATLRRLPITFAAMQSADPEITSKAFSIAEQQVVLAILDKWVEAEAERAEEQRAELKELDLHFQDLIQRLIKEYIEGVQEKRAMLQQPVLSVLISSLALGPTTIPALVTLIPALGTRSARITAVPQFLKPELAALCSGLIATVTAWATPMAMTLITKTGVDNLHQRTLDSSKAYAMTLATFITNPAFSSLLESRFTKAVAKGLISKAQANLLNVAFKTSLLLTGLALLYQAQAGGLTGKELKGVIQGEVKLEKNNFLLVLAKLINEQLSSLNKQQKEKLLDELLAPYDDVGSSLSEVLDPISGFIALWDPKFLQEMHLANPS